MGTGLEVREVGMAPRSSHVSEWPGAEYER